MDSLSTYTSTKTIDYEKSVVLSFDIKKSRFGVGHENGKIVYNQSSILPKYEGLKLDGNILSNSLNQKTFLDDKLTVIIDNSTITSKDEISEDTIYDENGKNITSLKTPTFYIYDGVFYTNSSKKEELNTGKVIYEIVSPSSEVTEDAYIDKNDDVYQKSKRYTCDDYLIILDSSEKEYTLQLEMDSSSIALLSVGEIIKRDLTEHPVYSISHFNNEEQTDYYYENPLLEDNTERFRFVFSNRGKILSISGFDNDKNCFIQKETFCFDINEETLPQKINVYTSSSSNISNVSTNF